MSCIRPAQQMGQLGSSLLSLVAESTFQEFEGLQVGWGRQGGPSKWRRRTDSLCKGPEAAGGTEAGGEGEGAARAERLAHRALQAVVSVPWAVRTLSEVGSDGGWLFEGSRGSEEKMATACSARG